MMDFLERMESSAERAYDEMYQGDGKLKCCCGKIFEVDEGGTVSANPWAMPVCPHCFDEWVNHQENKNDKNNN